MFLLSTLSNISSILCILVSILHLLFEKHQSCIFIQPQISHIIEAVLSSGGLSQHTVTVENNARGKFLQWFRTTVCVAQQ